MTTKGQRNIMAKDIFGRKVKPIDFSKLGKEQSKRDTKRSFTRTQKNEILYQQNGKCAQCHERLDPRDIEFDHKKAWASEGRTKTQNGRAVCGSCHNKISHGQRLNKDKKKPKQQLSDFGQQLKDSFKGAGFKVGR